MGLLSARKTSLFVGPQGPTGPQGPPGKAGTNGVPVNTIQIQLNGGSPYPAEPLLNLLPGWGPSVSVTDISGSATSLQLGGTITSPTVQGTSIFAPTASQLSTMGTSGLEMIAQWWGAHTTGSSTTALSGTFPLPGQSGAPFTSGTLHVDVLHVMNTAGGGSTAGATFKSSCTWTVTNAGVVTAEQTSQSQPVAIGTNAGGPPTTWASTLQLNTGSTYAEVLAVGDPSLATNHNAYVQALYAQ